MLTKAQTDKLKENWGDKAESLDCMAIVRIYNTLPNWECFVYAINPDQEDEISCIFHGYDVEVEPSWKLEDIMNIFNYEGVYPFIDHEFSPRLASEILNKLRREHE